MLRRLREELDKKVGRGTDSGGGGGGGVCGEAGSALEGLGRQGPTTVAVAGCLGMFVFTPLMHFLMFYAFFHSVCLGCAELWGYPDRNIYGPWWLVADDVRGYFRLWSTPVHRWLSKTIQRPMIEAGQREALRHRHRRRASREETEPCEAKGRRRETWSASGNGDGHGSGGASDGDAGGGGGGGGGAIITRWWMSSVVCSFLVSGVVHEAVGFVAMRRTFWPVNTLFLCLGGSMTPVWDALFPVIVAGGVPDPSPSTTMRPSPPSAADAGDGGFAAAGAETSDEPAAGPASPAETARGAVNARKRNGGAPASNGGARLGQQAGGAAAASADPPNLEGGDVDRPAEERCGQEGSEPPPSSRRRGGAVRPKMGSWRGWTSIVIYFVASVPTTLALDYLVWQWWRHTYLVE